jgi:hypothetical protein
MINSIKRLYEADDIQQAAPIEMPQAPQPMAPLQPIAQSIEEVPTFDQSQEEPAQLPQADVMNLTVRELIERCNKINPLICMGLTQFIELNNEQLLATPNGGEMNQENPEGSEFTGDEDINFSKQMEPVAPEFSLDNQTNLDFPQE